MKTISSMAIDRYTHYIPPNRLLKRGPGSSSAFLGLEKRTRQFTRRWKTDAMMHKILRAIKDSQICKHLWEHAPDFSRCDLHGRDSLLGLVRGSLKQRIHFTAVPSFK